MAKGKRTPALFEIINRAQTEGQEPHLQVPGWWRSFSEQAEVDPNLAPLPIYEADSPKAESDRANYDAVAEAVEQAAARVHEDDVLEDDKESDAFVDTMTYTSDEFDVDASADSAGWLRSTLRRLIPFESKRLELSLSPGGAAIGLVVGLAVLSVSFAWGHALGKRSGIEQAHRALQQQALDSVEAARKSRAQPSVLDLSTASTFGGPAPARRPATVAAQSLSGGAPDRSSRSEPSAGMVRQVGWNYLVVQSFSGPDSLKEAKRAQRFILANLPDGGGMPPVTIEQRSSGGHMLLSTIGYPPRDDARKAALNEFKEQIRRIGKLYRQQGGGYDFRDAYPMRLSRVSKRRN